MEAAPKLLLAPKSASVADAKHAYFEGDFERCLEICAAIHVSTVTTASEVALIRARALLRTGRPHEARTAIVETRETHATLDAWLTAQMLEASALIRQGDADAGIRLLSEAALFSSDAHLAIRSEIAFCTALGYWAKREIDSSETYLQLVDPSTDIIHARALELQAWCHTARGDYRRSAEFFRLTLLRLDTCQVSDRAISATAISTLAILAAELFDRDIERFVATRAQHMHWVTGLSAHRFVTLKHLALFHEFAGSTLAAYKLALQAHEGAATVSDDVCGWSLRSELARNAGETYSAIIFAQRAQELLSTLDSRDLSGEERFLLLGAAENCAHFDAGKAGELYAEYCRLTPIDAMVSSSRDPRLAAYESYVAGVVAQARNEHDRAERCYREAFVTFRKLGYVRRAVISARALLEVVEDDELQSYVSGQLPQTANFATKTVAVRSGPKALAERHPLLESLPRTQREVVNMICMGKTNKEIAQLRNVGEQTIKNMLTKNVFPAFGVSSRTALVSACLTRPESHVG